MTAQACAFAAGQGFVGGLRAVDGRIRCLAESPQGTNG